MRKYQKRGFWLVGVPGVRVGRRHPARGGGEQTTSGHWKMIWSRLCEVVGSGRWRGEKVWGVTAWWEKWEEEGVEGEEEEEEGQSVSLWWKHAWHFIPFQLMRSGPQDVNPLPAFWCLRLRSCTISPVLTNTSCAAFLDKPYQEEEEEVEEVGGGKLLPHGHNGRCFMSTLAVWNARRQHGSGPQSLSPRLGEFEPHAAKRPSVRETF